MSRWNVASASAITFVLSCASVSYAQAPQQPAPGPSQAPPGEPAPAPAPAPPPPGVPAAPVDTPAAAPPAPAPAEPTRAPEAPAPAAQVEPSAEVETAVTVSEPEPEASKVKMGEEIVVTGSRLRQTAFSSSAPVTVIKREDLERSGYTTLGDLTKVMPEGGGNSGGSGAVGGQVGGSFYEGQGVQMINLRGLGANATLVLINGRRLIANGPGGALESFSNVATIPVAMIERIEILRGGASAIYGSDAIAGVVNIITRKEANGVSAQVNAVTTDRFDQQEYEGNIMAGASNEHSKFSVGLNWYHSTPLDAADRDWTRGQFWSAIGPIGLFVPVVRAPMGGVSPAMDIGYFELLPDPACPDPKGYLSQDHSQQISDLQSRIAMLPANADARVALERQLTAYQLGQRFQGRDPSDPTLPYLADAKSRGWWPASVAPTDPRRAQAVDYNTANGFGCAWDFRKYRQLRPEMTRLSSMLSATHDLNDHLQIELEAQYADNRTTSKSQPIVDFRDARLNPGFAYDVDSTPWTANLMRSDGTSVPQSSSYNLWYGYPADYNAAPNIFNYDTQTFRSVIALRGDFEKAGANTIFETWDWELAGTYARSTWDTRFNAFQTDYTQRALDACKVNADGTLSNGLPNSTANRQRVGCFNPYYSSAVDPTMANDPMLLRSLTTKFNNLTVTQLYTADATLRGEIVPLPGGPMNFAAGGQYRYESRSAVYDNDTNLNRTPFGGIDDTSKHRGVWSAFAEMGVPLLRAVELQPAIRYETYQDIGGAVSPRVGLIVKVGDFFSQPPAALSRLVVRGTYARAFRAPNLAQTDPQACAYVSEDTYTPRSDPDPVERRSTRTQLLNGRVCGADNLKPEEATSYSAGVDWNFGNLHVESDFWRYDYSQRIIQPLMQRAIDLNANRAYCLLDPNADANNQSMAARAFVGTLAPKAAYFKSLDCAAVSREAGVAQKSLTPDQFLAKYPEVMYSGATGNPLQGATLVRYSNAADVMTRGIDFGVSYSIGARDLGSEADIGTFSIGIQGSYLLDFQYREAPVTASVSCAAVPDDPSCLKDAAGQRNLMNFNDVLPRLKFSVPLTYVYHKHQLALIAHFISGFKDDGQVYDPFNPPPPDVPSWTTFDAQYALNLSQVFGSPVTWRFGVQNIFDRDPPRIRQRDSGGFEPAVHDGRGRLLYTRLAMDL